MTFEDIQQRTFQMIQCERDVFATNSRETCDAEITESLRYHLRDLGVIFRFGEAVTAVERENGQTITHLASGKKIRQTPSHSLRWLSRTSAKSLFR